MIIVVAFAFVGGMLTILAPCTLPIVPLMLGAASTGGRRRTLGILLGFGLTFVTVTVLLASVLAVAGLTTDRLRVASGVLLGAVGLTLVVPTLGARVERRLTPLSDAGSRLVGTRARDGLTGGVILGGAIGLIWAPCVGPIMAGVIGAAAVHGPSLEAVAIALAYVTGAALPLAIIAGWGQAVGRRMAGVARRGRLQRILGVAMIVSAVQVTTGLDLPVQDAVAGVLPPGWGSALAAIERQAPIQEELDVMRTDRSTPSSAVTDPSSGADPDATSALPYPLATLPATVALEDQGMAPELTGIEAWINAEPLTMRSLRGKVVLVEFWTFGCINCIHVQPYVKAWYERDLGNVREAVAKADLRYPVAFDPGFATWNAYRNSYWPAFYFVDKQGRIRHVHFGEGDYDGSEQVIRELLSAPG
jgi:cytochrome c biogenesis protein CcdA/thiol-disulfide isomerase/thioredoxin